MQSSSIRFLIGLLFVTIPVSSIVWWIYITQTSSDEQVEMVAQFMEPIPDFISSAKTLTWIEIGFTAAASWLFIKNLEEKGIKRTINLAMLGFTGLIGLWLLFSLM